MKRNESIDSAAGIMIFYMVFTHVCQHYHLDNSHFYMIMEHLLYFFMPWFFLKAGMFFKIGDNKECNQEHRTFIKAIYNIFIIRPCMLLGGIFFKRRFSFIYANPV